MKITARVKSGEEVGEVLRQLCKIQGDTYCSRTLFGSLTPEQGWQVSDVSGAAIVREPAEPGGEVGQTWVVVIVLRRMAPAVSSWPASFGIAADRWDVLQSLDILAVIAEPGELRIA